jgi:hypothetical protein
MSTLLNKIPVRTVRRIEEQLAVNLAAAELRQLPGMFGGPWSSVPAWWSWLPESTKDSYRARISDDAIHRQWIDEWA